MTGPSRVVRFLAFLMLVGGTTIIVVGVLNAWKSHSGTAPLVVGVVLVALALLIALDVEEVVRVTRTLRLS